MGNDGGRQRSVCYLVSRKQWFEHLIRAAHLPQLPVLPHSRRGQPLGFNLPMHWSTLLLTAEQCIPKSVGQMPQHLGH